MDKRRFFAKYNSTDHQLSAVSTYILTWRELVRSFDVTNDLNFGLSRVRNPDKKCVKRPVNRLKTDEKRIPICLDRKVK